MVLQRLAAPMQHHNKCGVMAQSGLAFSLCCLMTKRPLMNNGRPNGAS